MEVTDLDTAVATPLLDTLVLATAVATTDMDTATAVATDSMVKFTGPKKSAIAGALQTPELAGVSALSYLTAGYHIWQQKNQN